MTDTQIWAMCAGITFMAFALGFLCGAGFIAISEKKNSL